MIPETRSAPRKSDRRASRVIRSERGTAVLEVALVLPLLLMLLFGIIIFGVDLGLKQSVTHAAAEAAREAEAAQITSADSGSQCAAWYRVATTEAQSALNWLSGNSPTITPSFSSGSGCSISGGAASGTPTTGANIYLTVQVQASSILKNMPGINVVAPSTVTSTATVEVQ